MHARKVRTRAELEFVWRLTHDAYVRAGYIEPHPDRLFRHHPHLELTPDGRLADETVVFYVVDGHNEMVGTVSCTLDSPGGLHTDASFPDETSRIRKQCHMKKWRLSGIWRIETARPSVRCVIGELLDTAYDWAMENADVSLCTFHPRHVQFYRTAIGMHEVARVLHEDGIGAPSVLMRFDRLSKQRWPKYRHRFYCDGGRTGDGN